MVRVDDLSKEIARQLSLYTASVEEEVELAKKDVAKVAVTELRQMSPELTGDYKKGWTSKRVGKDIVVHNSTNYQLTHLLENGHSKASGGRVAAKVHIAPVEEQVVEDYVNRVERAIRQ